MAVREGRFATKEMGMAVNSLQKQPARGPGRPFEKGRSGNPAGRPACARNKATLTDFAALNARSKFRGDGGRAGFKNWEEVTDPRNPPGGRHRLRSGLRA